MAVKIRLTRLGAKRKPCYRVVVADGRVARDGKYIERVGLYNPLFPKDHKSYVQLDMERVAYWRGKGAIMTERVAKLVSMVATSESK